MLEALIFDVDGTLAETEELHRRAFNDSFAEWRLDWYWSRADYTRLLKTTGGKERIAAHMVEIGASGVDIAALHRAKTARYTALMEAGGLDLRPGVAALMDDARAQGVRLAIATTTSRPNVEALCAACFDAPASDVFEVIAAGDEVAAKKPAPDVYMLALERLGLPARRCLALEDSRNGLISAMQAGLRVLVTPSAYTASEDFTGAWRLIPSLAETTLSALADPAAAIKE
ncbi:MAG: HAD family hydrolase [Rhodobacteraceae bacterium]|nr:HAD family hydrolase [Paracoccaceae bacterium]